MALWRCGGVTASGTACLAACHCGGVTASGTACLAACHCGGVTASGTACLAACHSAEQHYHDSSALATMVTCLSNVDARTEHACSLPAERRPASCAPRALTCVLVEDVEHPAVAVLGDAIKGAAGDVRVERQHGTGLRHQQGLPRGAVPAAAQPSPTEDEALVHAHACRQCAQQVPCMHAHATACMHMLL